MYIQVAHRSITAAFAGSIEQQIVRKRVRLRMIARQKAQAERDRERGTGAEASRPPSGRKASKGKASSSKASSSKAPAADDADEEEVVDDGGWCGWIWDDLVEMDCFWPHPLLAILETGYGTAALLFFQTTSGAPLFRYERLLPNRMQTCAMHTQHFALLC